MTNTTAGRCLPTYDITQSYEWNYAHPPAPRAPVRCVFPGNWSFCGLSVDGPLGIAAGPLLNGAWCLYYASLGWSVLTYKTVRSVARPSYPWPNLQPVSCGALTGNEQEVLASDRRTTSWAVSFGMPSAPPEQWRRDVEWTRNRLGSGQRLVVSVVGTVQPGWTIDDLAADYARCAAWAVESGADAVEANFSCPNVSTCDGQLYQHPADARLVAAAIRDAIGSRPLIIKIGHLASLAAAEELLRQLVPTVNAVSMTNSIALPVRRTSGEWLFGGERRGICGQAIRDASLEQVRMVRQILSQNQLALEIIGVGGVFSAEDVRAYLDAGANTVQCATSAMLVPDLVQQVHAQWTPSA